MTDPTTSDLVERAARAMREAEDAQLDNASYEQLATAAITPLLDTITALEARVAELEGALTQLECKARLGGDCLGNTGPRVRAQRAFYLLADLARAALKSTGER